LKKNAAMESIKINPSERKERITPAVMVLTKGMAINIKGATEAINLGDMGSYG